MDKDDFTSSGYYVTVDSRAIPLTQGKVAIVSVQDFRRVMKRKWSIHKRGGTFRRKRVTFVAQAAMKVEGRQRPVTLHRFIMEPPDGVLIDHKDGDGLNCTRENLRVATRNQNQHNGGSRGGQSQYKGVYRHAVRGKWRAQITVNSKKRHLGIFAAEEEAARAYDVAAVELHGEFARLNFSGGTTTTTYAGWKVQP